MQDNNQVGDADNGSSTYEFMIDLYDIDPKVITSLTEEISRLITEKTPKEFLQKAGDQLFYQLRVRLIHDTEDDSE